jgi:glutathione peroxidase
MKKITTAVCTMFLFITQIQAQMKQNIYQFKVEDLYGKTFDFATLKGKKVMIVNTASKCGLTPQYKDLEAL